MMTRDILVVDRSVWSLQPFGITNLLQQNAAFLVVGIEIEIFWKESE